MSMDQGITKTAPVTGSSQIKPYLITVSSSGTAWEGIVVEHVIDRGQEAHETTSPAHLFALHLRHPATLEWTSNGRTQREFYTEGDININPLGNTVTPRWEQPAEFALLALQPQLLNRVAEESACGGRVEIVPSFKRTDPLIAGIMHSLMTDVEQGTLVNRLYTDALANALALHLIKNHSAFGQNARLYSGGLSPSQLQRATDYLTSHLEQNPSLTEVAAIVGVSMHHFARAFKQSTGVPPHRYLMERRIERAKALLAQTDQPLAEIALRLGFSSQSHFTTIFRQITGTTPKSYRRAW